MINSINNSSSALLNGVQGFQNASNGIKDASLSIAKSTTQGSVNTNDIVSLQVDSIQAQASAKVIEVANDTVGQLIDTLA